MHYYNMQSDQIAEMHARIRELEDRARATAALMLEAACEINASHKRERNLKFALAFAVAIAVVALKALAGW